MDYTKLTESRLTEMESPEYWDQFERGVLAKEKRPTPREAAEFVRHLMAQIRIEKTMQRGMKCDMELTTQSYGQFIEAVEALARKYRPALPNT
jgi:hypothetical protein